MSALSVDNLKQWIGRERIVADKLSLFPARALSSALDRPLSPEHGSPLPPGWQWLYFLETPSQSETGRDGHPLLNGDFLPPVPLQRRMWASGSMRVEHSLKLGLPAQKRSVIRSIDAKDGKSGALVFVSLEHEYSQYGHLCIREEQNLVYREMPDRPVPNLPGEAAPGGADWTEIIVPDPVLLFRYSALTYNSHRIHYDRDYAVSREHYPALVVHGPLLATLLLEHAQKRIPDVSLRSFEFRAVRPSFDTNPFTVNVKRDGRKLMLWTADHEGYLCVSAKAELA